MEPRTERRSRLSAQLVSGLLIIAAGVVALLDNFGVVDGGAYFRYWPIGLIAIGLARFRQARGGPGRLGASVFVAAGTWLLLESFGIVHISVWQLWPLLLCTLRRLTCLAGDAGPGQPERALDRRELHHQRRGGARRRVAR